MAITHRTLRDGCAIDKHITGEDRPQARDRLDQLCLPVALDTGDSKDLAWPDAEAHVVNNPYSARSHDAEVSDLQAFSLLRDNRVRDWLDPFARAECDFTPDHGARDL